MAEAASHVIANHKPGAPWVGRSIPRVEDLALLTGRGRFIDDLGVRPGTLHAAILRSPHAHADIVSIDLSAAKLAPGVVAVLHGEDIKALTTSLVVGVKAAVECWPIAVGRVRYVGEPVAIVVATDRYLAEDAVDLIEVRYEARPAVVDPLAALAPMRPSCTTALRAMSPATGRFVTAIRSRRLRRPRTGSVSTFATRAIPARRSKPMAWSPNTIQAKMRTMCSPISRAPSASMRCCRGR